MPSRWDRMVEKEYRKWLSGSQEKGWLSITRKLLSRQHARVVRMVRRIGREATTAQFGTSNEAMAWKMACAEILAALRAEGKGGKP